MKVVITCVSVRPRALAFKFLPSLIISGSRGGHRMFTSPFVSFLCKFSPSFITWLFFFSRKLQFLWLIGNKTSCRPIRSVIILVMNKSDSRCVVVRFCYHSYDYRPNWTPLSPITITYRLVFRHHRFPPIGYRDYRDILMTALLTIFRRFPPPEF